MWSWDYAISILPELLGALKVTVMATLYGFVVASVVGLLLAFMRRSRWKSIAISAGAFVEFVRNTPLLVQVFFLFFIANISLSAFTIGVIGLGLHYSTYMSEVYRAGIDAVPKGQWEAAKALNLSGLQTWLRIVLPQAIPPIIPIMGNYLIVMFKETPILAAITVLEMLHTAKNLISESYRVFEPYTIIGLLFLLVSYPASLLVRNLENRLNRQRGY
jgi:polar amino acid transport system permease protein